MSDLKLDGTPHYYWERLYTKISPAITKMMQDLDADILRADGRIEKSCEKGCGHPVGHARGFLYKYELIHGCSGNCAGFKTQEVRDDPVKETDDAR